MADRTYRLEKLDAGDYLLRFDGDDTIYRVFSEEALGSGARGMYGHTMWFLWRWPETEVIAPRTAPRDSGRWKTVSSMGTRREAIRKAEEDLAERSADA